MIKPLLKRVDELDKKYGRGPTYGPHDRKLILDRIVPEWLLRGRLVLKGEMQARCEQLIQMLERAHTAVAPLVRDESDLPEE